jgi:Tat protein translocase TatB subunit
MFGPLGGPELLLIFVIALIVFGPRKLPEMGRSLGKMMAEFRRASNDLKRTIESEVEADQMREAASVADLDLAGAPASRAATPVKATSSNVPAETPANNGTDGGQDD